MVHRRVQRGARVKKEEDRLTKEIIGAAIEVHRHLGPGLPARHSKSAYGMTCGLESTYESQLWTYLKLADLKLGILINFNVPILKEGIKRIVNNL